MFSFTDQLGRVITLQQYPQRIVSLVPSQTELLYHLGLEKEVVGITKFCTHPKSWFLSKRRIGGTKSVNIKLIKTINPHLIIANKEENIREQIDELSKHFPVWVSDVNTLENAIDMITSVGTITGKQKEAEKINTSITTNFLQLYTNRIPLRTAYLIWQNPYMSIGGDTFINNMLSKCGFNNIFSNQERYPTITITQLQEVNCELLLLSSEPFPFKQKHINELQQYLPTTKIVLVDGEMFSWYGSRLMDAPAYFTSLFELIECSI